MHGARRVITFCLLTAVLPTVLLIIPLYLRHSVYADVTYAVAESDVLEIVDGMSTVFCQEHTLRMNTSFHAFQLSSEPERSNSKKHIRLKKSMVLPDDTLEYWGFYLLKGSTVVLSVCSRFEGSRILVVKGERNLRTCGLRDHTKRPSTHMSPGQGQVRVTFETQAQEIVDTREQAKTKHLPTVKSYTPLGLPHEVEHRTTESTPGSDNKEQEVNNTASEETDDNDNAVDDETDNNANGDNTDKNEDHDEIDENRNALQSLDKHAQDYILKHMHNETVAAGSSISKSLRKVRHAEKRLRDMKKHDLNSQVNQKDAEASKEERRRQLSESLNGQRKARHRRSRRETGWSKRNVQMLPPHMLDAGVGHGGNALNFTEKPTRESSVSSFENSLLLCYDGHILLAQAFPPSHLCTDVHVLENSRSTMMQSVHEVDSDGYYYYIFYSDNDFVQNDIHAMFDIHKPTYQYTNFTKGCVNQTECSFPISFLSEEIVIVEVPTRDGIEHDEDDITLLVSSCHPRMSVYVIFPIAVLFLILGCAFL